MSDPDDVLVIGGGVIGVCSAYYLARAGCRVRLIEKGAICSGASWGNAGLICASHVVPMPAPGVIGQALAWMADTTSPFYIKPRLDAAFLKWLMQFARACDDGRMRRSMAVLRELSAASRATYDELASLEDLSFDFHRDGLLMVYGTAEALEHGAEEAHMAEQHGIRATILDREGMQAKLNGMACAGTGGVFYPDDAHLDPGAFVEGLARIAQDMGVTIQPTTEVLGWEVTGGRIVSVRTTRGDLRARRIVLATGVWSPSIARDLKITLPIQAAKGYSVTFRRPANCPTVPMLLGETRVAVTPLAETLRLGGTLELTGMDLSVSLPRVEAILNGARRFLPTLDAAEVIEIWRGLRPCTPDGLPIIGRCQAHPELVVAAGHGTLGVLLAPATGKLVAQIVLDEPPFMDPTPLRVERFD